MQVPSHQAALLSVNLLMTNPMLPGIIRGGKQLKLLLQVPHMSTTIIASGRATAQAR